MAASRARVPSPESRAAEPTQSGQPGPFSTAGHGPALAEKETQAEVRGTQGPALRGLISPLALGTSGQLDRPPNTSAGRTWDWWPSRGLTSHGAMGGAVWPGGGVQPLGLGFLAHEKEPKEEPALGCREDGVGAACGEPPGPGPARRTPAPPGGQAGPAHTPAPAAARSLVPRGPGVWLGCGAGRGPRVTRCDLAVSCLVSPASHFPSLGLSDVGTARRAGSPPMVMGQREWSFFQGVAAFPWPPGVTSPPGMARGGVASTPGVACAV